MGGLYSIAISMWRCGFVVVVLLPFLATQVMAGARQLSKAQDVCSNMHELTFMNYQLEVAYEVKELKSAVWHAECHRLVEGASVKYKNELLAKKAKGVRKISDWVCYNLREAHSRGDKSYIANEFYETLTTKLREAYRSISQLAQLGALKRADALAIVAASATQAKLPALLTDVVTRLPCFCRLLKLMSIDDDNKNTNKAMCHSILAKSDTFEIETHGAADLNGLFWKPAFFQLPKITQKKEGTCTSKSLTSDWEPDHRDNWFACAATYMVNGYEVLLVPKGLMMYHGSRTLPAQTVPDGLTWFGDLTTAARYTRKDWGELAMHQDKAVRVRAHAFETRKFVFVVRLMVRNNNKLMLASLPEDLDLRKVTGYPAAKLYRESVVKTDRLVFGALCPTWQEIGIAGYAETLVDGFHPEVMLCDSHGFVKPFEPERRR